jgi:ABC-type sugar transport system ATPase subunit
MDEPLSNLDAGLRLQIRNEIAALQRRLRATMLYVTHDQVEAMTLGDRVAVLNRGRLQQAGAPQTLYQRPANIFVAGFFGNPGMNVFETELVNTGHEALALRWGERNIALPLPTERRAVLQRYLGQSVYAGLRPEAFSLTDDTNSVTAFTATVNSVEALGHEALLYFDSDVAVLKTDFDPQTKNNAAGKTMVARLPGRFGATDSKTITLQLMPGQLYFFASDGRLLSAP